MLTVYSFDGRKKKNDTSQSHPKRYDQGASKDFLYTRKNDTWTSYELIYVRCSIASLADSESTPSLMYSLRMGITS